MHVIAEQYKFLHVLAFRERHGNLRQPAGSHFGKCFTKQEDTRGFISLTNYSHVLRQPPYQLNYAFEKFVNVLFAMAS